MINNIKMAMKNNKLNADDCGPKLEISEDGLEAKSFGQGQPKWNWLRAVLSNPSFNFGEINKSAISSYFEMQILNKAARWSTGIVTGFRWQKTLLEYTSHIDDDELKNISRNSIGINYKSWVFVEITKHNFENEGGYFKEADFVGLGIIQKPNSKMECFATLNGKLLGKVELPEKFAKVQLFPAIALFDVGQLVRVNFGKEQWQFKEFERVLE